MLEPNSQYTLSFWIKGKGLEKVDDSFKLALAENEGQQPLTSYTTEEDEFGWRQIILSFTTGGEHNPLDLKLGILGGKGTVWIDDLALKKGNTMVTASYTEGGSYLESITDANGIEVARYDYSHPEGSDEYLHRGIYSSVIDAKGNSQEYDYDILDRVISVKDAQSQVSQSYSYNSSDNLERISRDTFDYLFTYDTLGRMISV